jgi:hypothetical protein
LIVPRAVLPLLPNLVTAPVTNGIANGGFEAGLASWQTGGPLGASLVQGASLAHSGNNAVSIGSASFSASCNGSVPVGNGYISQQVAISNLPNPTLTFWYRIFTQDWTGPDPNNPTYDWFGVYVNSIDAAHSVFLDGNPSEAQAPGCSNPILDLGWRQGTVNLQSYAGQSVTLYFVIWNEPDPVFNTYAYLDDVALTYP